jgi:hypothetical protein
VDSEPASSVRFVALGGFQRLLDEVALPTCDGVMEWESCCCLDVEWAPLDSWLCQFFLYLFSSNSPSTGLDGGAFDQMLQFPHVARKRMALQGSNGICGEANCGGAIAFSVARKDSVGSISRYVVWLVQTKAATGRLQRKRHLPARRSCAGETGALLHASRQYDTALHSCRCVETPRGSM